jgi:hypothetical protein
MQRREDLLTAEHLHQFNTARRWLRRLPKAATFPRGRTSYGLKHVMQYEGFGYCTNGSFIAAAALAEGFRVKRDGDGPNAWLGINRKVWDRCPSPHRPHPSEKAREAYLESVEVGLPPWLIPEARQVLVEKLAAVQPAEQQDAGEDTHWTYDHDLDQVAGSPWLQD